MWAFGPDVPSKPTQEILQTANEHSVPVLGIRVVADGSLTSAVDRDVTGQPAAADYARAESFRKLAAELGETSAALAHRCAAGRPRRGLGVPGRTRTARNSTSASRPKLGAGWRRTELDAIAALRTPRLKSGSAPGQGSSTSVVWSSFGRSPPATAVMISSAWSAGRTGWWPARCPRRRGRWRSGSGLCRGASPVASQTCHRAVQRGLHHQVEVHRGQTRGIDRRHPGRHVHRPAQRGDQVGVVAADATPRRAACPTASVVGPLLPAS